MTRKTQPTDSTTALQPWQLEGWNGPIVETRPADAGPEWPERAVERVTFTKEAFPHCAAPHRLPYTEHFGTDGWPLHTPEGVKSRLDTRCQAELRRYPWTCRPECWSEASWVGEFSDHDRFLRLNAQVGLIGTMTSIGVIPVPHLHA